MSFSEDDEILQDFLVEAGEILDQLSEQLVGLENAPDDQGLLNAIFRGFHTVKGGAGFLQLDPMVECCHITENLFDILRTGKRPVTPELMDVVLQALDQVNLQFQQVQQGEPQTKAPSELIARLERLVSCEDLQERTDSELAEELTSGLAKASATKQLNLGKTNSEGLNLTDDEFEGMLEAIDASAQSNAAANEAVPSDDPSSSSLPSPSSTDEISEDEFEALLDQLHGSGKGPSKADVALASSAQASAKQPSSGKPDEISEDEFENLLDQLHGAGKGPSFSASSHQTSKQANEKPASSNSDLISDDEFENLLDQLHGSGKGPTAANANHGQDKSSASASVEAENPKSVETKVEPASPKPKASPAAVVPPRAPTLTKEPATASKQVQQGETTVRVDTQRLDDIMNMVGELVLVRNRLVRLGTDSNDESLNKAVANLDVVTGDLQTAVMKTRMQPIKKVFGRFPRVVRDLARNLKKEISLELVGEETDLDKNLVEALADPLVHLVRNSVDHGIEMPSVREERGKSRVGKVVLAAQQEGDHILLSISDDGAGMNADGLRASAVEKGMMDADAAARLSDNEAFNLIFAPGFSTKKEISDVSGRGVGMDVVKTKISQLNGSVDIQSTPGKGTVFTIKVPLTLAIMPTLMIMLGHQCFALPLVSVNEIFHMDLTRSNVVDGQECVTIRNKAIPIFHLKKWLVHGAYSPKDVSEAHVVIVSVGTQRVGFVVDQLVGQEEVVIKPLGRMLQGTPGMAGATITGDGTIALILDIPSMLNRYAGSL